MSSGNPFATPLIDFTPLGQLGKSFQEGQQTAIKNTVRQKLSEMGADADYTKIGQLYLQSGDAQTGAAFLQLGEQQRQAKMKEQGAQEINRSLFGGGGGLSQQGLGQSLQGMGDQSGGDYISRTRARESNGNPTATNPNSSAAGLYQATGGTWNDIAQKYPDLGLTPAPRLANGKYGIGGRFDPEQQEKFMQVFTRDNAQALQRGGFQPTDTNLYAAHFLGAGDANNFLSALQQDPTVTAASVVQPKSVSSNRSIFFDRDGRPRTVAEVYQNFEKSHGGGGQRQAQQPQGVQVAQSGQQMNDGPQVGMQGQQPQRQGGGIQSRSVSELQQFLVSPYIQLGQKELIKMELERRQSADKPTDIQRNYDMARQQGYQGTLLDYQKELRAQTNVNLPSGEKTYDQTVGKATAEQFVELQKTGRDAIGQKNRIQVMQRLVDNPEFYSGFGGNIKKQADQLLAGFGIKAADAARPEEVFEKLSNEFILDKAGGSLGAQISNSDRDFMRDTAPNLANTREGNKALLYIADKIADRQMLIAKLARDYAKQNNGRIDAGFEEELRRFSEENPMFAQEDIARITGLAQQGQAQRSQQGQPQQGQQGQNRTKSGVTWSVVQ